MTEQVMELARALGGAGQDEDTLRILCAAACRALDGRLKDGLTAEDCEGAYPLAAAWLVKDWTRGADALEGVTSLSAGDLSVQLASGGGVAGGGLTQRAWALMRPWLRDDGFVFRGVSG